jgi:eukaryotic-like serine/threonine-protein kinase
VVVVAELLLLTVSLATGATRQLLYADPLVTPTFDRSVLLYAGASLVAAVPGVALVVVFLTWLHRVHLQLTALRGPGALRFGSGLAVGGWFIPFANFVLPLLEVRDLFRASAPGADADAGDRPPAMLWVWWAALLVLPVVFALTSSVLSFAAGFGSGGSLRAPAVTVVLEVGSTLSRAVAALLAVRIVGELTRRCDRMFDQLGTR